MTDLVSLLFIAMIAIDCKITKFSLHLLYVSLIRDKLHYLKPIVQDKGELSQDYPDTYTVCCVYNGSQ